jgi:hypothetical protein
MCTEQVLNPDLRSFISREKPPALGWTGFFGAPGAHGTGRPQLLTWLLLYLWIGKRPSRAVTKNLNSNLHAAIFLLSDLGEVTSSP